MNQKDYNRWKADKPHSQSGFEIILSDRVRIKNVSLIFEEKSIRIEKIDQAKISGKLSFNEFRIFEEKDTLFFLGISPRRPIKLSEIFTAKDSKLNLVILFKDLFKESNLSICRPNQDWPIRLPLSIETARRLFKSVH